TVLLSAHVVCELTADTWSGTHTVVSPRTGLTTTPDDPQQAASAGPTPISPVSRAPGGHRSAPAHAASATSPSESPTSSSAPPTHSSARQTHIRPADDQSAGGTSRNGLAGRAARSILNADAGPQDAMETADTEEGHAQLLADLDAFADGQQQAHDDTTDEHPSEESQR